MKSLFQNSGILGINARNLLYIRPYNKKRAVRLADDKLKTKQFLSARDIPVPRLYSVIRNQEELQRFDFSSLPGSFVLKPNLGFGGEGIIPIVSRKEGLYEKPSGEQLTQAEFVEHIGDILAGRFSLSGATDQAFFEQRVVCDERLAKYAYKGLPDIRIVVHNLIPVMAMLRLPTRESDGRANIHQGAMGVGIDIARGTATHMVHKGKIITEVPGVGPIQGVKIPYWDEMLLAASRVQLVTNLGYLAVDLVLDKNVGPVLLEINARAGLGLQIANLAPLRRRLERIQGVTVKTPEKGVRIAQDMFGNKIEKEVKKVSGKQVIGSHEKIKILAGGETRYVWASVNPLLENSLIDRALAEDLSLEVHEEGEQLKLKFSLADTRVQTLVGIEDLSGKSYDMVIGRRDLSNFLIDPAKGKPTPSKLPRLQTSEVQVAKGPNFLDVDRRLISIDRQLKLLYHLKPSNLAEERDLFMKDPSYNPQFVYPEFRFDALHLKEKLKKIKLNLDDSPLAELFLTKLEEIEKKIRLLEAIGTDRFDECSVALYGEPTSHLRTEAKRYLDEASTSHSQDEAVLTMEEAVLALEKVLADYGLDDWRIKVKSSMVANCLAGKNNVVFVREGAVFKREDFRQLVAHEIETHVLTAVNGKAQSYRLFNRGFADYLQTQEGLAIWNQRQVALGSEAKLKRAPRHIFAIDFARKHSFAETADFFVKLGLSVEEAFRATLRVKRGLEDSSKAGAFTKDGLYFSGYLQVKDFIQNGGNLRDLYYGKYNITQLDLIKQVPHLREPKLLPHFLRD